MQSSVNGKKLNCGLFYKHCQNFLCDPEKQISEWFPTVTQARLRVKALDPYGNLKLTGQKGNFCGKDLKYFYSCSVETCHAKLILRTVQPDHEGNKYGLYGCFEHQHPMSMEEKRCEIIFKNKNDAKECFEQYGFNLFYKNGGFQPNQPLSENHICRRRKLKKGLGYYPCKSYISILRSFQDGTIGKNEEMPFSLVGIFYHSHKNDERFHKNKLGGFKRLHDDPSLDSKRKRFGIRVKDGKIFPAYARKYVTVEEVLAARVGKGGHKRKKKPKPLVDFKQGSSITTDMIDLDERIRNSGDLS